MKTAEAESVQSRSHYARASDGTRLRYFDSEEQLPAILLANGLGGPVSAWEPYFDRWRGRFRVLTWDYRGLYGSTLPGRHADLSIEAHARDVASILDEAGIQRCALLGWSMGVQVALEFYSQARQRVTHLALINGTYGAPLGGVPLPFSHITLPPLVKGARRLHRLGSKLVNVATRAPLSFDILRKLRFIGGGLTRERFERMVADFRGVDMEVYLDLLSHLHEHDAGPKLSEVDVATLVMTGSRDLITPPWLARHIATTIPRAEFFMIPDGTHYAAAEYPDIVAARFERFFAERPFPC